MAEKRKVALRLHGVTKSYGAVTAIRSLSFDVQEGRFFVLFGPSAVGKTTTLRTIAGLVAPEAGRIEIAGQDVTHAPIAGRGISMVFQSFALYPHLTVYGNFAYPLREAKTPRRDIDRRVKETAEMLRLSHRLASKPGTLSGGEQATGGAGPIADRPAAAAAPRRAPDKPRRKAAPRHARGAQTAAPAIRHDDRLCNAG
jgi:multiple sugar transport system ATP-binding protein